MKARSGALGLRGRIQYCWYSSNRGDCKRQTLLVCGISPLRSGRHRTSAPTAPAFPAHELSRRARRVRFVAWRAAAERASVVLTLASVATIMPSQPAPALRAAPTTKQTAMLMPAPASPHTHTVRELRVVPAAQ